MELASTLPPFLVTLLLLSSYGFAQKYSLRSNSDGSFLLVPANATAESDNLLVDLADLGPIPVKTNAQEPPGTNSQTPQMIIAKLPKPSASNPAAPAGPQTTSATQTAAQTAVKPAPQPKPSVTPQVQPPVTQCPGPTCKPKQNLMTLALKGKDGARGKPGSKGPPGPQGQNGSQGKKGPIGQPGICQPTPFQCSPGILATLQAKINALEKQCKSLAGGAASAGAGTGGAAGGAGGAGGAAGGGAGAGGAPPPPTQPPKQKGPPCNIGKCKENPAANCQVIYIQTPSSVSGAFWIRGVKEPFKTLCQFEPMTARGWTLVARIQGSGIEFSPVSNTWADASTINEFSSFDKIATTTMKNRGWSELKQNVMRVCYEGPDKHCADFSHNKGITLTELFNNQFGVEVDEKYTFESLLRAFGKSCDTSRMVRQWCGLNVASICHPQDINPNLNPTNHIARIGCVGDILSTCGPDDFALGLGVSSCYDRYGCAKVGPLTSNLHWACVPKFGSYNQTSFLYVN